jgi:hypothetical protein
MVVFAWLPGHFFSTGGGLFGPDALMRLAMDSRTRHLMEDKEFQGMLHHLLTFNTADTILCPSCATANRP